MRVLVGRYDNYKIERESGKVEKAIIITQAGTARKLIKSGEELIDIKPHRQIPNASVFIFKPSENIERILEEERSVKK